MKAIQVLEKATFIKDELIKQIGGNILNLIKYIYETIGSKRI